MAPTIIPDECSAENNSVTVAWQPPAHGFVQGYVLELDDGSGGEFGVSVIKCISAHSAVWLDYLQQFMSNFRIWYDSFPVFLYVATPLLRQNFVTQLVCCQQFCLFVFVSAAVDMDEKKKHRTSTWMSTGLLPMLQICCCPVFNLRSSSSFNAFP